MMPNLNRQARMRDDDLNLQVKTKADECALIYIFTKIFNVNIYYLLLPQF